MKLYVLGCGDAFGSGGRNQSGYVIAAADRLFLLDCGPTSLPAMKKQGFDPGRLEAILISHLHGDHFAGLPFFFLEYMYERQRERPLHIAGPEGTEQRVRDLFSLMYSNTKPIDLLDIRFHVLQPGETIDVEGIEVFSFRVPHQVQEISLALKVAYDGRKILFSGDSAWTDDFLLHACDVDMFLCECSYYERQTPNHMNYLQLRQQLAKLQCKKILLTHLGSDMIARLAEIPYSTAQDGLTVEF